MTPLAAGQLPALPPQLVVELRQLPQEPVIGPHVSVLPHLQHRGEGEGGNTATQGRACHLHERGHGGHVVSEHEVGEHRGRAARHSLLAVNQHLTNK